MSSKRCVYSFLLMLLFFIKSTAFHAYTHDSHSLDAADHCQTCEIQQLQTPLLAVDHLDVIHNNELVFIAPIPSKIAKAQLLKFSIYTHIWSRPPPSRQLV